MAIKKDAPKAKTAGREEPEARIEDDRNVIRNRAGEVVSLKVKGSEDKFKFDPRIVPKGWHYEWKRESVYGWTDVQHQVDMAQNGWEPVPAERHDGLFLQKGEKGAIRRAGMILMERDMRLTLQSRAAEKKAADTQVGSAFQRAGMQVPTEIADFSHDGAKKVSGFRAEREGFATQSEESYSYQIDE